MSLQTILDSFKLNSLKRTEQVSEFSECCEDSGGNRVYGGHVMAQAMSAAQQTVDSKYLVHSMNCNFYRPGVPDEPILYRVEHLRDGRSFATRLVQAYQNDKPIFTATFSLQTEESSFEHGIEAPDAVAPEKLISNETRINEYFKKHNFDHEYSWPMDVRYVDPVDISEPKPKEAKDLVWMRANGPMPDDLSAHCQLLAYASDNPIGSPPFNPHGKNPFMPDVIATTLSHSLWVHRPLSMSEWLLFDISSDISFGGRGMSHARVFNQHKQLVASATQELLMRQRRPN
ncbi:MAG: acyl-CoA thioesterase [Pseudomonadales bacterium]